MVQSNYSQASRCLIKCENYLAYIGEDDMSPADRARLRELLYEAKAIVNSNLRKAGYYGKTKTINPRFGIIECDMEGNLMGG